MRKRTVSQKDYEMIEKLAKEFFPDEKIINVNRLGGMTNHTYCVSFPTKKYLFRLPGEGTEKMINRSNEKISTELACRLDIDASLIDFNENTGVKIGEYIEDSETMSPETLREPENIKQAALLLRKLHSCGENTGVSFDVFGMSEDYEQLIQSYGVKLFEDYLDIKDKVFAIRKMQGQTQLVPCHNDPLCENWIKTAERMYLVDWEYAGMNEGMWDVADVAIEAHMDDEMAEFLLETYLGHEPDKNEKMNFISNEIYLDFLWSLWGKTRVPFEGDMMEEYALERYIRLKQNLSKYDQAIK